MSVSLSSLSLFRATAAQQKVSRTRAFEEWGDLPGSSLTLENFLSQFENLFKNAEHAGPRLSQWQVKHDLMIKNIHLIINDTAINAGCWLRGMIQNR